MAISHDKTTLAVGTEYAQMGRGGFRKKMSCACCWIADWKIFHIIDLPISRSLFWKIVKRVILWEVTKRLSALCLLTRKENSWYASTVHHNRDTVAESKADRLTQWYITGVFELRRNCKGVEHQGACKDAGRLYYHRKPSVHRVSDQTGCRGTRPSVEISDVLTYLMHEQIYHSSQDRIPVLWHPTSEFFAIGKGKGTAKWFKKSPQIIANCTLTDATEHL